MNWIKRGLSSVFCWTLASCFLLDCENGFDSSGKTFQYSIKNTIREPTFFHTVTLPIVGCNDTVVTEYMEMAADQQCCVGQNDWTFAMTYFAYKELDFYGYFVTEINGVAEEWNLTFWELIEHSSGERYQIGASSYVPQQGDHVAWNLTVIVPQNSN